MTAGRHVAGEIVYPLGEDGYLNFAGTGVTFTDGILLYELNFFVPVQVKTSSFIISS